jgi:hypothetical protein
VIGTVKRIPDYPPHTSDDPQSPLEDPEIG